MEAKTGIASAVADLEGADRIRTGVSPLSGDSSDKPSDYEWGSVSGSVDWLVLELDVDYPLPRRDVWTQLVKLRANYTCEDCGESPPWRFEGINGSRRDPLTAHHIDGCGNAGREADTLRNGRCLCISCHQLEHRRMRQADA